MVPRSGQGTRRRSLTSQHNCRRHSVLYVCGTYRSRATQLAHTCSFNCLSTEDCLAEDPSGRWQQMLCAMRIANPAVIHVFSWLLVQWRYRFMSIKHWTSSIVPGCHRIASGRRSAHARWKYRFPSSSRCCAGINSCLCTARAKTTLRMLSQTSCSAWSSAPDRANVAS